MPVAASAADVLAALDHEHLLATNADLARRLDSLESKYDKQFSIVFEAIRQLMVEPEPTKPAPIGFTMT